jgi:hypothetical protein
MQTPESTEKKAAEYTLTLEERKAVQALNMGVLVARSELHDAEAATEKARQKVRDAELYFQGALNLLATAHGMDGAQLTPDLAQLRKA